MPLHQHEYSDNSVCKGSIPLYEPLLLAEMTVAKYNRSRVKRSAFVARKYVGGTGRVLDSYSQRGVRFYHEVLSSGQRHCQSVAEDRKMDGLVRRRVEATDFEARAF